MQTQTSTAARIRFLEAEESARTAECAALEALNVLEECRFGTSGGAPASAAAIAAAVAAEEEARWTASEAWDNASMLEDGALEEAFTEFSYATYARYRRHGWPAEGAMDCVGRAAGNARAAPGLAAIRASRARLTAAALNLTAGDNDVYVVEMVIGGVTYLYDKDGGYAGIPHLLLTRDEQEPIGTYDAQSGEIIFHDFEEEEEEVQQPQR